MVLHVNDLTVDELRALMREVVEEVVEEKLGLLTDPDEGLELREDVRKDIKTGGLVGPDDQFPAGNGGHLAELFERPPAQFQNLAGIVGETPSRRQS